MWKLGKFVVMTKGELEERRLYARHIGYQAGLRSKWRAKKEGFLEPPPGESFVDDVLAANRGDTTTEVGKILNRNVATYSGSTEGELPTSQFNMKEAEAGDAA